VSDVQVAADWWQASDGKWYPPGLQSGQNYSSIPTVVLPPDQVFIPAAANSIENLTTPSHAATRSPRPWTKWAAVLLALLVGFGLGAVAFGTDMWPGSTPAERIDAAMDKHQPEVPSFWWSSTDGVAEITLTGDGDEIYFADTEQAMNDVLEDLGFSTSIGVKMGKTRALDGTQEASSDCCTASWTYHPDDGLQLLIEPRQ